MKILFIADPLIHFKIHKETTYAMMLEAQRRGDHVFHCNAKDLAAVNGQVSTLCTQIQLIETAEPSHWYDVIHQQWEPLTAFNCVLMRQDPPFDIEYFYYTHLLEAASAQGAIIYNYPEALRNVPEKLSLLEFSEYAPDTLITRDLAQIIEFHKQNQDIIIKPLDGMGGRGIFRVKPDGLNLSSIVETLGNFGANLLMVQQFLPEIAQGDKRILIFGGDPIPYALARIPQNGEVRGNMAAGGKPVAQAMTEDELFIAREIGERLWQKGLFLVGLDMIGLKVTEINVTSPTGFQEIHQQTGFDVTQTFFDRLEQVL